MDVKDEMNIVSDYLTGMVTKLVNDHNLVVWYDPDGTYTDWVVCAVIPKVSFAVYRDSFLQLRRDIDPLLNDLQPPRLVVYVPQDQAGTDHALIELEAAGVVMQPGQQPPARNTRLSLVARNSLKPILGDDNAAEVEK